MVGQSMDLYVFLVELERELIVDAFEAGFGWIWYVLFFCPFIFRL